MKKIVFMIVLMVTFAMVITGCGGESVSHDSDSVGIKNETEDGYAVSFVCGIHESYPYYGALMNPDVQNAAYKVAYEYGDVSGYIVDGDPFIVINQGIDPPDEWIDGEKRKMLAEDSEVAILESLSTEDVIAKCEEVDTLQAITLSANSLHSSKYRTKEMYILDSGLSTDGVLDFAHQNIIESDPEYIVDMLTEQHAIPNLEGITIRWIGFGQTCGEQKTLSSDYLYKLKNIWQAILEEGGAIIDDSSFNMEALENIDMEFTLPNVTQVPIVISPISPDTTESIDEVSEESTEDVSTELIDDETILVFREDTSVNFQPNTAEFIDESMAINDLSVVVNYLKASQGNKLYIAGMTATYGDSESCKELSLERANAVKNIIMQADPSIKESQMVVLGLGYADNDLRVQDIINGEFVEEQAQKNRAVYILGENASVIDQLISIAEVL